VRLREKQMTKMTNERMFGLSHANTDDTTWRVAKLETLQPFCELSISSAKRLKLR